jgi:hypothetical protein
LSLVSVCVLLGTGLCDGLIPRPEESYRVWCVEMSVITEPKKNEEAQAHRRAVEPQTNKNKLNTKLILITSWPMSRVPGYLIGLELILYK